MPEFCEMIRSARLKQFKTAKDFYRNKSVSCTYAYYSKVEKDTVPEMTIALELIDKLSLNSRKALYAWTRDHMPTNELKAIFSEIGDKPSLSSEQKSLDRSCVVNRMQSKLLMKDPVYWEILLFFSTSSGKFTPTPKLISKEFGMSEVKVNKLLSELFDYALIDKNAQDEYVTKEWMFIPYEDEFKPLRDWNFRRAFDQFSKSDSSTQFRTTITCCLLPRHQKIIEAKFMALSNELIDLAEKDQAADTIPYTVGIYSSPRRFGNG